MTHNNVCGGDRWLGGGAVVGLVWCGGIECDNGDFWVEVECGGNGLNRDLGKRGQGFFLGEKG